MTIDSWLEEVKIEAVRKAITRESILQSCSSWGKTKWNFLIFGTEEMKLIRLCGSGNAVMMGRENGCHMNICHRHCSRLAERAFFMKFPPSIYKCLWKINSA